MTILDRLDARKFPPLDKFSEESEKDSEHICTLLNNTVKVTTGVNGRHG